MKLFKRNKTPENTGVYIKTDLTEVPLRCSYCPFFEGAVFEPIFKAGGCIILRATEMTFCPMVEGALK